MKFTIDQIKEILELHKQWLNDEENGKRANLYCANLSGADLYCANLYCADLYCANLSGADLYGANLRSANLSGADLSGANLYCANLSGANLRSANLSGANLSGANLSGAKYSETEILEKYLSIGPIGSRKDYLQVFVTDKQIVFKVGCFSGSCEEFKAQIKRTHKDNEHGKNYLAAIEFVSVMVAK
jgi:hypothetical protein